MRGAGDTRFTLFVSLIGACGIRVCLTLIFINVMGMGLEGAWISYGRRLDCTIYSYGVALEKCESGKKYEFKK